MLEYASPLWHPTLTKAQSEQIEGIQRRALNFIYPVSVGSPYVFTLAFGRVDSLQDRRLQHLKTFFRKICQPGNCLHHLLPPQRDPAITTHLRKAIAYPIPRLKTVQYCSTISNALKYFQ